MNSAFAGTCREPILKHNQHCVKQLAATRSSRQGQPREQYAETRSNMQVRNSLCRLRPETMRIDTMGPVATAASSSAAVDVAVDLERDQKLGLIPFDRHCNTPHLMRHRIVVGPCLTKQLVQTKRLPVPLTLWTTACVGVCVSVCLSVYLSICLSVCQSIREQQ